MRCDAVREQLSLYVDNDLGQADRAQVDDHLAACAACRGEAAALSQMLHALKTLEQPAAPDLLPAIRAQLETRPGLLERLAQRFLAPWPVSLPLHGLALATMVLLVIVATHRPTERIQLARRELADEAVFRKTARADLDVELQDAKDVLLRGGARHANVARMDAPKRIADQMVLKERPSEAPPQPFMETAPLSGSGGFLAVQAPATKSKVSQESAEKGRASLVSPTRYAVRWSVPVQDAENTVRKVTAWVQAQQGYLITLQPQRYTIKLPAGIAPAFFTAFAIQQPATLPPATDPNWVTIDLELVPSE